MVNNSTMQYIVLSLDKYYIQTTAFFRRTDDFVGFFIKKLFLSLTPF
jgi:hypothetical protein